MSFTREVNDGASSSNHQQQSFADSSTSSRTSSLGLVRQLTARFELEAAFRTDSMTQPAVQTGLNRIKTIQQLLIGQGGGQYFGTIRQDDLIERLSQDDSSSDSSSSDDDEFDVNAGEVVGQADGQVVGQVDGELQQFRSDSIIQLHAIDRDDLAVRQRPNRRRALTPRGARRQAGKALEAAKQALAIARDSGTGMAEFGQLVNNGVNGIMQTGRVGQFTEAFQAYQTAHGIMHKLEEARTTLREVQAFGDEETALAGGDQLTAELRTRLRNINNEFLATETSLVNSLRYALEPAYGPNANQTLFTAAADFGLIDATQAERIERKLRLAIRDLTAVQSRLVQVDANGGNLEAALQGMLTALSPDRMYAVQRTLADLTRMKPEWDALCEAMNTERQARVEVAALYGRFCEVSGNTQVPGNIPIMPAQRIPRWVMLLTDLARKAEEAGQDDMAAALRTRLNAARLIADVFNWKVAD